MQNDTNIGPVEAEFLLTRSSLLSALIGDRFFVRDSAKLRIFTTYQVVAHISVFLANLRCRKLLLRIQNNCDRLRNSPVFGT